MSIIIVIIFIVLLLVLGFFGENITYSTGDLGDGLTDPYVEENYQYVDKLYGSKIKIGSSKNPNYMTVLQINFNNFALKGID